MSGILIGVGVGPGDPEQMTLKAVRVIRENEVIAVPGNDAKETVAYRIAVQAVPELEKKTLLALPMPMIKDRAELAKNHDAAALQVENVLKEGKNVVFLTLGDPTVYSTFMYVHSRVKAHGYATQIVSGIPSFCAAAARMDISLTEWNEELHVIPAVHNIEQEISYPGTRVLMKSARKIGAVKEMLMQSDSQVFMVENCGMENERIFTRAEDIPEDASYYSLIIVKNPKKYAKDREQILLDLQDSNVRRKQVLAKNIEAIETKAFHTLKRSENARDAVNDMLSGLIIADSEPLKKEDIILCQKWERHVDGNCKTLNLLRECLKPGTIIKSTITIDTKVCKLNIEDIVEGVKLFYQMYYENFQSKFRSMNNRMSNQTVFLGGGSGFVSKTMIYAMFGAPEGVRVTKDIFFRTNVPRQHKHQLDTRLGVSPHILKCTRYQGKEYMIGQCELSFR